LKTDVDSFSPWDPKNKGVAYRLGNIISLILAIPTILICSHILANAGYSPYLALAFFPLAIPTIILHELIHAVFQWLFSKQKPHLGFKRPFPYSKLGPNSSVTRNQGVLSSLAPLFLITLGLLLAVFFVSSLTRVALIIVAYLHASTCTGDLHFARWLLRQPSDTRLRVEDMTTVVFVALKESSS